MRKFSRHRFTKKNIAAFTLIELIIVIALIASAYTLLLPNFSSQTASEVLSRLDRLSGDVRSAFDLAVLNRKTYRMVFEIHSGLYWLEETDQEDFFLASSKEGEGDPSPKKAKEMQDEFETQFEKYTQLAGEAAKDPDSDKEIPQKTPVLEAKSRLKQAVWKKVESIEWGNRQLTPLLIIKDMQAEHHPAPVTYDGTGSDEAYGHIYFFPSGYVERAYLHIYYMTGSQIDESKAPWTVVTHPYRGEATVESGLEKVDFNVREEE